MERQESTEKNDAGGRSKCPRSNSKRLGVIASQKDDNEEKIKEKI